MHDSELALFTSFFRAWGISYPLYLIVQTRERQSLDVRRGTKYQ